MSSFRVDVDLRFDLVDLDGFELIGALDSLSVVFELSSMIIIVIIVLFLVVRSSTVQ